MTPSKNSSDIKQNNDQDGISLVSGYVHNVQQSLDDNLIPEAIVLVILSFYYVGEFFKDTQCTLQNNDQKVICNGINQNAYGNVIIDRNSTECIIHEWSFKIGPMKGSANSRANIGTNIGIAQVSVTRQTNIFATQQGYAFGGGNKRKPGLMGTWGRQQVESKFKEGDIVIMRFIMNENRLEYRINDEKKACVTFAKVIFVTKFRMAVFLEGSGDWIELIAYKSYQNKH